MADNYGELSIARVLDKPEGKRYKMVARLETGSQKGVECYVFRKDQYFGPDNFVVRSSPLNSGFLDLSPDERRRAAFFITSEIPKDFESSSSSDTILYGIWQNRMRNTHHKIPVAGKVSNYYDPGFMRVILHYDLDASGDILPYMIIGNSVRLETNRDGVRSLGDALHKYLKWMEKFASEPRVVTVHEEAPLDQRILPEFRISGRRTIKMETQH